MLRRARRFEVGWSCISQRVRAAVSGLELLRQHEVLKTAGVTITSLPQGRGRSQLEHVIHSRRPEGTMRQLVHVVHVENMLFFFATRMQWTKRRFPLLSSQIMGESEYDE